MVVLCKWSKVKRCTVCDERKGCVLKHTFGKGILHTCVKMCPEYIKNIYNNYFSLFVFFDAGCWFRIRLSSLVAVQFQQLARCFVISFLLVQFYLTDNHEAVHTMTILVLLIHQRCIVVCDECRHASLNVVGLPIVLDAIGTMSHPMNFLTFFIAVHNEIA